MAIYCDGSMNSDSSPNAWASVVNSAGNDLICYYSHLISDFKTLSRVLPKKKGKRKVIVCFSPDVKMQQNNYAELIAMVIALRIALHVKIEYPLEEKVKEEIKSLIPLDNFSIKFILSFLVNHSMRYRVIGSDSNLIINWWSKGFVNADTKKAMSARKYELIQECALLRKNFEKQGGKIIKVEGSKNPADLGYH